MLEFIIYPQFLKYLKNAELRNKYLKFTYHFHSTLRFWYVNFLIFSMLSQTYTNTL